MKILPSTIDWGLRDEAATRLVVPLLLLERERCELGSDNVTT